MFFVSNLASMQKRTLVKLPLQRWDLPLKINTDVCNKLHAFLRCFLTKDRVLMG